MAQDVKIKIGKCWVCGCDSQIAGVDTINGLFIGKCCISAFRWAGKFLDECLKFGLRHPERGEF
jgi:hypothetical protein